MKTLVQDYASSPLLPGSILVLLATRQEVTREELHEANRTPLLDLVGRMQQQNGLDPALANQCLHAAESFHQAFAALTKQIPEVAAATGTHAESLQRMSRALWSGRLVLEISEGFIPPNVTYERSTKGTIDLLKIWREHFESLVGGVWSVLFPLEAPSLVGDVAAQFWMGPLHGSNPPEMAAISVAYFRREYAHRLKVLNTSSSGTKEKGLRVQDAIGTYIEGSREKLKSLHQSIEGEVKAGLETRFQELVRILEKLGMPWLVSAYFEFLVAEVCHSLAALDGALSSREHRFVAYLLHQMAAATVETSPVLVSNQSTAVSRAESLETLLGELSELVGLESVKEKMRQTAYFAHVQQMRISQGLQAIPASYHSVFTGNPGTGKTTVARLLGRIYKSLGILKRGHLVECDRGALVGEYVGQTAVKTNALIDTAMDGILLIDEAYALSRDTKDFGQEAIETLLKRMEDDRARLIVVVTGYTERMERFIKSNPGLQSRFTRFVDFPDYSPLQLCQIFGLISAKSGLRMSPDFKEQLLHHLHQQHEDRDDHFGNARLVRNLFEAVTTAQASRISALQQFDPDSLSTLEADDLQGAGQLEAARHRSEGRGYEVPCSTCGVVYAWSPSLDYEEGQCGSCNQRYSVAFGRLATGA